MVKLKRTIAATAKPVTLDALKEHLRLPLDFTDEDASLNAILATACEMVEVYTQRSFEKSTWKAYLDTWPENGMIVVNKCPLSTIKSFKYFDEENQEKTMVVDADYMLDDVSEPWGILLLDQPTLKTKPNTICIEFEAGYEKVPGPIISAILLICGYLREYPEDVLTPSVNNMPKAAQWLLRDYRITYRQ